MGHKSRVEAEVELLKAEAAKVVETQQALVEADQQRGQLVDDKGRLQAEVERLREQATTAEEARQAESPRREAAEKAAEDKDAELKAALAKAADLEKALRERDRVLEREQRGTLLEVQHLEESFSSKCGFFVVCRVGTRPFLPCCSSNLLLFWLQGPFRRRRGWRKHRCSSSRRLMYSLHSRGSIGSTRSSSHSWGARPSGRPNIPSRAARTGMAFPPFCPSRKARAIRFNSPSSGLRRSARAFQPVTGIFCSRGIRSIRVSRSRSVGPNSPRKRSFSPA